MNSFTIMGKCKSINKLDRNNYVINLISSSPAHKDITVPIQIKENKFIHKIKENDLLGVHGTIDELDSTIIFLATKVIWLSNK